DVPSTADDQRAVKSPGQSLRSMVCAHGVVVVVPVTGAARHPSAVLGPVRSPATPYIGSTFAGCVEGVVERAAVGLRVVLDPVGVDGQPVVGVVHQLDLESLTFPHLQDRSGDGGFTRCESIADHVTRKFLGEQGDASGPGPSAETV